MRIPDFSQYDGGSQFVYQNKIFYRKESLGCGSFAEAFLFETKNKKDRYVVKCEKGSCHAYVHGDDFASEAKWCEIIYGLGVLSGESKNNDAPHYILMPYFSGELFHLKVYQSVKELFFYWILVAMAINNLHQKHYVIHGDLKSDNVVAGNNEVFLIDFGFATAINHVRKSYFYPEDRFFIQHQSPELFSGDAKEIKAHESQDVYSLGCLLRNLFFSFYAKNGLTYSELSETQKKVWCVTQNMTHSRLSRRWSIEKSIYMLNIACLSQLPKEIWNRFIFEDAPNTVESVFDVVIQMRMDELKAEQKKLSSSSPIKAKKIDGLGKLQERIAKKPACALDAILEAKKDRVLTAGVFSNRTEVMLDDLADIGRTFQLLH